MTPLEEEWAEFAKFTQIFIENAESVKGFYLFIKNYNDSNILNLWIATTWHSPSLAMTGLGIFFVMLCGFIDCHD